MIDPVAKLGERGGDKALQVLVAVELFAVAPESFKSVGSQSPKVLKIRALARTSLQLFALERFLLVLDIVFEGGSKRNPGPGYRLPSVGQTSQKCGPNITLCGPNITLDKKMWAKHHTCKVASTDS